MRLRFRSGRVHFWIVVDEKMERPRSSQQSAKLKRATDRSEITTTVRKNVLRGAFTTLKSSADWRAPPFKLLPFISSTFTDTQLERDFLQDLLFEMRAIAKQDGESLSRHSIRCII